MGLTFKTTVVFCCFESKLHCYSANHERFFFKKEVLAFSRENNFCILFKRVGKKIPSLS